jgi:hypothetical protein
MSRCPGIFKRAPDSSLFIWRVVEDFTFFTLNWEYCILVSFKIISIPDLHIPTPPLYVHCVMLGTEIAVHLSFTSIYCNCTKIHYVEVVKMFGCILQLSSGRSRSCDVCQTVERSWVYDAAKSPNPECSYFIHALNSTDMYVELWRIMHK